MLLQAGAVLLAPVNALQGLAFVWLWRRPGVTRGMPAIVAAFWLASLLTGYQAVLFAPLVLALFLRADIGLPQTALYVAGPVGILVLATLANPLAVASLVHHGAERAAVTGLTRVTETTRLWFIGGSGAVSVLGTLGILASRRWDLWAAFAAVTAFVLLNWFPYYSVLFTPLLIAGMLVAFERWKLPAVPVTLCVAVGCVVTLMLCPLAVSGSAARSVMAAIRREGVTGTVLISGVFGHEWQYESRQPVERFSPEHAKTAAAVVCPVACDGWEPGSEWRPLQALLVPTWVRLP